MSAHPDSPMAKPGFVPRLQTLSQYAPNGAWQLELAHSQPCSRLIWITRGQGRALIDGQQCGVGTHNVVFVPANSLFSIDFGGQGFAQILSWDAPDGPIAPMLLRLRDVAAIGELNSLLDAIGREQNEARSSYPEAVGAYATLVQIWLQRQNHFLSSAPTAARTLMQQYCANLANAENAALNMSDHATMLEVTPTHLSRVSKSETGRTAAALLAEVQVHRSRVQLAASHHPINEVARTLGFTNASHFTRFVRQHTGMTPSEIRRRATRAS